MNVTKVEIYFTGIEFELSWNILNIPNNISYAPHILLMIADANE